VNVAVIGAGVAGLSCAYWLRQTHRVTLFEADDRLGGHANTVRVALDDGAYDVDTGFIVYNEPNYPMFSGLLDQLGVATQPSEMSFSVSAAGRDFEYRGNGLGLWAQPSNALRPSFQRLLADVLRFNRAARRLLATGDDPGTLADLVAAGDYGPRLVADYLVPLGSAIWSADPATFTAIPARTFAAFLDHHGMLQLKGRPQWRTVSGGSHRYVAAIDRMLGDRVRRSAEVVKVVREPTSVTVLTGAGPESFDAAVLAVHSDQALALLGDPSPDERTVLGAIRYQSNVATLHTDARLLPRRRSAWASWNAHLPAEPVGRPTVTYWMNRLQRIESSHQICVTLNRDDHIDPTTVLESWTYAHPIYDSAAVAAQRRQQDLHGHRRTWYCGAYWGYGFHEDGASSAADVCRELGAPIR
jgi:predicted NAD/FAD-binding protein